MKKEKLAQDLRVFLSFLFWMLIFGFAVRCFEWAMLSYYQEQTWMQLGLCLRGFCYDVLFFSKVALVLFPIHWLIYRRSPKAAAITFRVLGTLMLLISNAMIMYFVSADIPLDKVFFTYSVKVLIYISQSTGAFVWWGYVGLLLIPALFFVVSKKEIDFGKPWLFAWLGLAVIGFFFNGVPSWMYETSEEKNTICNKQEYFWTSLFKRNNTYFRFNHENLDKKQVQAFQANFPDLEFVNYQYPFCHKDLSPDVLSGYFDLKPDKLPNFVFIITEGLGREFSGPDSPMPSATPFLDSLANTGLYWTNCMSSSQRTFAVLPTMFANLPFGKNGFMQSKDAPQFQSLVSILKDNGYSSAFFYGGWLCFDDMCFFLKDMGVNEYLPDYHEYPEEEQNTWGLLDHVMFREAIKKVSANDTVPRLDIYLTLTTHDPFEYPNKAEYTRMYEDKLVEKGMQKSVPQYLHERFASYMYYDDCLRKFFADYSQLPGYENTIFIITGDHHFNSLAKDKDRCHVPLVMWSPMLKESHRFPAVVTHRDVTPSLLAMMKSSCAIQSPEIVSWINTGLDTVSYFRSETFTPQATASHELINMLYKDQLLLGDKAYRMVFTDNHLNFEPIDKAPMLEFMSEYKTFDDYVMNNNALLPINEKEMVLLNHVEEKQSANYTLSKTNTYPIDTLGRSEVFKLKQQFPFKVLEMPFEESLKSVVVYCDCDLYIPSSEKYKNISFGIAVVHADNSRETLKIATINQNIYSDDDINSYADYDQWHHFSLTQNINRASVPYQPGDVLIGYFVNLEEHEFYLTDFTMKVVGVLE